MKPWEETWFREHLCVAATTGDKPVRFACGVPIQPSYETEFMALDLAAAAPEMARLLLAAIESRWWNKYGQEDDGRAWERTVKSVLDKAGVAYPVRDPWDSPSDSELSDSLHKAGVR